jgi:hypothetical protein
MKPDGNKIDKIFEAHLDFISSSEESDNFLREEGLDPDKLVDEVIRKVKLSQLKLSAQKTESEYLELKSDLLQRARLEVEKLLADVSFNLEAFLQREKLNVAFKNFEKLTSKEVKEFLEQHFLLKMENESKTKSN